MKKGNKKALLKVLVVVSFVFVFMFTVSTFTLADVGNFNTYDSGSSSSSSWSSSSSGYSSSYDSDSDGGIGGIGGLIVFVIVVVIVILANKGKLGNMSNTSGGSTGFEFNNTKAVADRVRQSDPNFSEEQFLMWAKDLFVKLQTAWTARDFEAIRAFETSDLFEQHSTQLKEYVNMHKINVMERISVNYTALTNYETDGAKETITVRLNAKMKDYIINADTQELLEGNKETYWDRKYELKFVRTLGKQTAGASDELKTTNCPNCGAPTKITSAGKCEYCGSVIVTDDHDWVLASLQSVR